MFTTGSRITDIVGLFRYQGQYPEAVRTVRGREPERRRWRKAVAGISESAGSMLGRQRHFVIEPVREMVLDLGDTFLRNNVVLDAWQRGVDLDRGEVLKTHTTWDLRRKAFLNDLDLEPLLPWVDLPKDSSAPVKLVPVILAARERARLDRSHAAHLSEWLDDENQPDGKIRKRVMGYLQGASRWDAFSEALCN